ncbi:MAG: cysteine desulfurase family protein, partial [Polyangiaceae bacterium]
MQMASRESWANPSSVHGDGRRARARVEDARANVGALAVIDPRDVILTSGGTEANNLALRSSFVSPGGVLVTSRLEHPSVTRVAEALEREGRATVHWLRVESGGAVDVDDLARALELPGVRLVAVQAVNHETGVIQPIRAILERTSDRVPLHVDAVQAFGRVAEVGQGAATRSIAAHKLRGPKGIGALITRTGVRIEPVLLGGAQERGIRPGTTDPIAAAGFAVAAQHALGGAIRYAAVAVLRDRLEAALLDLAPGAQVNGEGERAPHVTNISFPRWLGPELVAALDLEGLSVSSGSACSAGTHEPSPVITAMLGDARAASAVRMSLGESSTMADVDRAISAFSRVLSRS